MVAFLDQGWNLIGTQGSLCAEMSSVTGIAEDTLNDVRLARVRDWNATSEPSIATRVSWVSRRICTREEDIADCLLGIFGINLPLLYGEGGDNAFRRLRLEVMKSSDDESIFAWYSDGNMSSAEGLAPEQYPKGDISISEPETVQTQQRGLHNMAYSWEVLAPSPYYFRRSRGIECQFETIFKRLPYSATNKGLQLSIEQKYLDMGSLLGHHEILDIKMRVFEIPLNCIDRDRGARFCSHISQPGDGLIFDKSRKFPRFHSASCKTPPDAAVLNRPSRTQAQFRENQYDGNSETQIFYLYI